MKINDQEQTACVQEMLHQIPQVNITDPPVVEITLPLPPHPPRLVTEYIVIYIIIIYLYYISHTVFPRLVTDYFLIYKVCMLYVSCIHSLRMLAASLHPIHAQGIIRLAFKLSGILIATDGSEDGDSHC